MCVSWFLFALICILGWGSADLFYKKAAEREDRDSHLKTAVWVGLVMGVGALILLPFSESGMKLRELPAGLLRYAPASLCYIISMVIGYAGLRYLELSVVSPVQNASGALSGACILVWFLVRGKLASVTEAFGALDLTGTILIIAGVIALAILEQRFSPAPAPGEAKYTRGARALIFPLLYCVFDTLGTAADGILLDEETGLGLGEIDVLVLYGLTFALAGLVCEAILWKRNGRPYVPFRKSERSVAAAALCEEFGQIFYVYAMAREPVLAAPMVASYCIVSVVFSRLVLRERLKKPLYLCILLVISGIVLLGISEGLSER